MRGAVCWGQEYVEGRGCQLGLGSGLGSGLGYDSCIHDLQERVHHPVVALVGRQAQGRPAIAVLGVHLAGVRAARGGDARGLRGIGGRARRVRVSGPRG